MLLSAKLYGFKLSGPPYVPEADLCQRLLGLNETPFKHGNRNRHPIVADCDNWTLVTVFTEKPKEDRPIGEESDAGSRVFRIEPKEKQPDYHETTCIAFCRRRNVGVVASYRGGFSIRQICAWIAKEYRQMIKEELEKALSSDRTQGLFRGMTDRDIKVMFPIRGSVECLPLQEEATLQETLKKFASISKIRLSIPEHDDDPAAPLRGIAKHVGVTVDIQADYRRDKKWRMRIPELLRLQHATGGKIYGETEDGREDTLPINDEIFALDNFDRDKLMAEHHYSSDTICDAPIFGELKEFVENNPRLFGA